MATVAYRGIILLLLGSLAKVTMATTAYCMVKELRYLLIHSIYFHELWCGFVMPFNRTFIIVYVRW
jgi:hypothetical protein